MVKSAEVVIHNYARKSLMAFLEDEQNLNWIVGIIKSSGVRGTGLSKIFENLKDYGNSTRYNEVLAACHEHGWLN